MKSLKLFIFFAILCSISFGKTTLEAQANSQLSLSEIAEVFSKNRRHSNRTGEQPHFFAGLSQTKAITQDDIARMSRSELQQTYQRIEFGFPGEYTPKAFELIYVPDVQNCTEGNLHGWGYETLLEVPDGIDLIRTETPIIEDCGGFSGAQNATDWGIGPAGGHLTAFGLVNIQCLPPGSTPCAGPNMNTSASLQSFTISPQIDYPWQEGENVVTIYLRNQPQTTGVLICQELDGQSNSDCGIQSWDPYCIPLDQEGEFCFDQIQIHVNFSAAGIPDGNTQGEKLNITSYPNPATDHLNIQYQSGHSIGEVDIITYDLNGKLIQRYSHLAVPSGRSEIQIPLSSEYSSGVYFYELITNGESLAKNRFLVLK